MERLAAVERLVETRSRPGQRFGAPAVGGPAQRVLALQRAAGNRAVTQMVQRCGGTGCGCAGEQATCGPGCTCPRCSGALLRRFPKAPPSGIMQGTLDPPRIGPFEGAVSSDPYDRQPQRLLQVLEASGGHFLWKKFDRDDRMAVTTIYNRISRLGLWPWVRKIHRVKKGTPPWCGFWVQGDTPSVEMEGDSDGLMKALLATARMCMDVGIGATLHPGQHSFREISEGDSLHLSVGPAAGSGHGGFGSTGLFDAHIDRYASPKGKKGFACEYDVGRTLSHEGQEVVGGMFGKKRKLWGVIPVRLPGLEVFPEDPSQGIRPEMFERTDRDKAPPPMIGIKLRFPNPWGM